MQIVNGLVLQTTLCLTAAALVLNFWLGMRIGKLRQQFKVSIGDGGNELILRRMRAQANFHEAVPLTLIMFGLVEASGRGGVWLAPLGALFLVGRLCHAFGMESDTGFRAGRAIGMITGMIAQLTLVVFAVLITLGKA